MTALAPQVLLTDGALAGTWVLDPRRSSIRVQNRSMRGLIRVHGVFREVSGTGIVGPDGAVGGTVTVAAASIDTKNTRRDTHLRSANFSTAPTIRTSSSPRTVSGRPVRVSP